MIEKIPQLSVDFTTGRTQSKANNILFDAEDKILFISGCNLVVLSTVTASEDLDASK